MWDYFYFLKKKISVDKKLGKEAKVLKSHKSHILVMKASSPLTSVLLRSVVVVDLFADTFAFAQVASQIFLLLLVMVTQQLLPVVWIHALLLLNDLPLNFLLLRAADTGCEGKETGEG